jgi:hypothetical protein
MVRKEASDIVDDTVYTNPAIAFSIMLLKLSGRDVVGIRVGRVGHDEPVLDAALPPMLVRLVAH